jgi:hypothetical protein
MAKIRDFNLHGRIFAEYSRRGPEFGTHAFGFPDMDNLEYPLRYLLSWSMAGSLESGSTDRSQSLCDVPILHPNRRDRINDLNFDRDDPYQFIRVDLMFNPSRYGERVNKAAGVPLDILCHSVNSSVSSLHLSIVASCRSGNHTGGASSP